MRECVNLISHTYNIKTTPKTCYVTVTDTVTVTVTESAASDFLQDSKFCSGFACRLIGSRRTDWM